MAKNVKSTVKIYNQRVRRIEKAERLALEQTAKELQSEIRDALVIPMDTGALHDTKFFIDYSMSAEGKVELVHEGPYARRMYYHPEYHFNKDEATNAKGKWFEDWLPGGREAYKVNEKFAEFLRRYAGL